jgi:hypothetical protein
MYAQARPPDVSCAHAVPAQQGADVPSQASPRLMQTGCPAGEPAASVQTVEPGDPTQGPLQQSSGPEHMAPTGAHASAQVKPPAASRLQKPVQHCSATEQGAPAPAQPITVGRQRMVFVASAAQRAPAQHSSAFMHSSPSTRHLSAIGAPGAFAFAQRPTPSGPTLQTPEQQVAPVAQRSCSGWQPAARAQRLGPVADGAHAPEQQSLSPMHTACAGRQPGSA